MKDFIHPKILAIAETFQAGTLEKKLIKTSFGINEPEIPECLEPFLLELDLKTLREIIVRNALVYGHPLVRLQLGYLLRLRQDESLWKEKGWKRPESEDPPYESLPPEELIQVFSYLKDLVQAHVRGLLPFYEIHEQKPKEKTGAKGGIKNPHPIFPEGAKVWPEQIYFDWKRLRDFFKENNKDLRIQGGTDNKNRIIQLCLDALDQAGPAWSAKRKIMNPGKLDSYHQRKNSNGYPISSKGVEFLEMLFKWSVDLEEMVEHLTKPAKHDLKLKDQGMPAYYACALIARLLECPPKRILNCVDNHLRSIKKKKNPKKSPKH